jgi:2-amino-4-hydroxy-6-hydroxymethyldihydropteridine diphosphokinase
LTPAAVALGGNTGRVERAFAAAVAGLRRTSGVRVVDVSGLYRSEPWGVTDQPDYLNGVVLLECEGDAASLLRRLHELEDEAGRERRPGERWGPRPLDLDLLWFGDEIRTTENLELPHPRLAERAFVLRPLVEVAAGWRHPVHGRTARQLLGRLRRRGADRGCRRIPGARLDGPEAVSAGAPEGTA